MRSFGHGPTLAAASLLLCGGLSLSASGRPAGAFDHSKFHIGVLCFNEDLCDDAHVRELADCGIDNVQGKLSDKGKSFLAKYGVYVRGESPFPTFWGPSVYGQMQKVREHGGVEALEKRYPFERYVKAAEAYRPRSNEWSYNIGDEMSVREFPYLARIVNLAREKHPDCEPHINHHPCWQRGNRVEWHLGTNYVDMIRAYCRTVPTDYVSYDFYLYEFGLKDPKNAANNLKLRDFGTARYLDNLRIVADACRDNGRMFDFIAGVNAQQEAFEVTEQMIRYQAYTAMAFGVQKLSWACWSKGWWHRNVVDTNGVRTAQYERLRTVNRELRAFCDEYIRYRRVGTQFAGFTGRAAKWLEPSPEVFYPQQNFNASSPLSTVFFTEIAATDGLPLVVSDFEPRVPDRSRGLFICAADDPWDENPVERTVRFRTPRRVRVFGGQGKIPCEKGADGFYTVRIRSNSGVFVVGE